MRMKTNPKWTFFTNHSHVLFYLYSHPDMPLREVAQAIGITERAVQGIITDLESAGALERKRVGRKNHYTIHTDLPLRHKLEAHCTIGTILSVIRGDTADAQSHDSTDEDNNRESNS